MKQNPIWKTPHVTLINTTNANALGPLDEYMEETEQTIIHLTTFQLPFLAESENDLNEIRRELNDYGFIKAY